MLQIIVWMGCAYLIVKALEIASSSAHRDQFGKWNGAAGFAIVIAVVSAAFFFWIANEQVSDANLSTYGSLDLDESARISPMADSAEEIAAEADAVAAEIEAAVADTEAAAAGE